MVADDFRHIENRHKRRLIDRIDNVAQLANLELGDNAVQHFLAAGDHALGVHDGDGAPHLTIDLVANLVGVVGDDERRFCLLHLGFDHVDDL